MIRIGQAGIPLSCKGRTNKDGLIYTREILDLNTMEVQFVRGLYVMEEEEALFMNEYAKENDVELHVHAPYYINLADDEEAELSFDKIFNSGLAAEKMGAKTVVVHPGYYGEKTESETMENIISNLKKLQKRFKKEKITTNIGIETMGNVFNKLIERNTTIPTINKETFTTTEDNQTVVRIHVLQGESENVHDNVSLGYVELLNILPAKKGLPKIEVSFDIDANGILKVSAKDLKLGKEHSAIVLRTHG